MDYLGIISEIQKWSIDHGLRIIIILLTVLILRFVLNKFGDSLVRKIIKSSKPTNASRLEEIKREDTVISIIRGVQGVILWGLGFIMILSEFGIEIAPILATAGVAGLAVGFGGQYLIKDVISGFFVIMENQLHVGDVVNIDGISGAVESVTLRLITLRDLDGVVHHIPNGSVSVISNMTKEMSRVNLNIGISYNANLENVIKIINQVGADLAKDEKWAKDITKAPEFLRVDDFAESAMIVKILGETKPSRQWDVKGELRKRLKIAFDDNGIEIPFPQVVIHSSK